jgi:hypothetical protein
MQQKDTKSISEVRLGGPLAVCTVCTVCTRVCTVCTVCTGVHNGEIADVQIPPYIREKIISVEQQDLLVLKSILP